jgi:hypothetical protein
MRRAKVFVLAPTETIIASAPRSASCARCHLPAIRQGHDFQIGRSSLTHAATPLLRSVR